MSFREIYEPALWFCPKNPMSSWPLVHCINPRWLVSLPLIIQSNLGKLHVERPQQSQDHQATSWNKTSSIVSYGRHYVSIIRTASKYPKKPNRTVKPHRTEPHRTKIEWLNLLLIASKWTIWKFYDSRKMRPMMRSISYRFSSRVTFSIRLRFSNRSRFLNKNPMRLDPCHNRKQGCVHEPFWMDSQSVWKCNRHIT